MSGRSRMRELRDRVVASDPGLGRLRMAAAGVASMGSALLVEWGFGSLLGLGGQTLVVGLLLGAVVAMMGSMALSGSGRRDAARTAAFFPVAIGVGLVAGVAVGGRTDLMLAVFVVVMFLAVFVRRFGGPFFFYGFMAWMGYFFAAFLHATPALLPVLFGDVVVASVWVLLLSVTVLAVRPAWTVQRMLRSFGARAREVSSVVADLLVVAPHDERRRRRLERRLHDRRLRLAECALMIEGVVGEDGAAPEGWPASALRRQLIDAQIAVDAVAAATEALSATPDHVLDESATLVRSVRAGAAGDWSTAAELARRVATEPGAGPAVGAERRVAAGIADYAAVGRRWFERPEADAVERFAPQVMLMMGNLPGSAAVAREVPSRGARWNPLARLDLTTRQAVQVAVAGGLAILLGRLLSEQRYYWAVIAAFVAFTGTATRSETFLKATNRVVGTLVGLVAATGLAELTGGRTIPAIAVVLASMFCGFYLIRISYAYMIFFITIMVGQLYVILGEFSTGLLVLRLEETMIGAAVGFLVALLVMPMSTRDTVRAARAALLGALADLLDDLAAVIDPGRTPVPVEDGEPVDAEARLRFVEDRLRQLDLVSAPLGRPMVPGHDHRRTRLALRLFAVAVADARRLTVLVRRTDTPLPFATAAGALAGASRGLAEPVGSRPVDGIRRDLADADVALFETARATTPSVEATARVLVHLARLLREVLEGSLRSDAALERAVPPRRSDGEGADRPAVVTGLVADWNRRPVATGTVTLIDMHGRGVATVELDRDGAFRLTAPSGATYTLLTSGTGRAPQARRVTLGPGVLREDLVLSPGDSTPVDVTTPSRTPNAVHR